MRRHPALIKHRPDCGGLRGVATTSEAVHAAFRIVEVTQRRMTDRMDWLFEPDFDDERDIAANETT